MALKNNFNDLAYAKMEQGNFGFARASLTQGTGAQRIGCSAYRLEPGKKAFPYHFHHANEEAILVLAGQGVLRIGPEKLAVKPGDYLPFPVGAEYAHQMANEGTETLVYLCFSTLDETEIVEYPDSNKLAVCAGAKPGLRPDQWKLHQKGATVGYYDGEE